MKKAIKNIVGCLLLFILSQQAMAQIQILEDSTLIFGTHAGTSNVEENRHHWININQLQGIRMNYNSNQFFIVDLAASDPRLSGTHDRICFYDPAQNAYKNIYVSGYSGTIMSLNQTLTLSQRSSEIISALWPVRREDEDGVSYGFSISSLEKVLPEAIERVDSGNICIDYSVLLPVLTHEIEILNNKIERQQVLLDSLRKISVDNEIFHCKENILYYIIPDEAKEAYIQICDKFGKQIDVVNILGTQQLNLNAVCFENDAAFCSLIIDEKIIGIQPINLKNE